MANASRFRRPFLHPVVPDRLDLRDRPYIPAVREAPPHRFDVLRGDQEIKIPRLDQKNTSACTGFALSTCVNILLHRAKRGKETPVSPFMIYSMARRYDEFPGGEEKDSGSSLRGAMKGWYKHGVCMDDRWSKIRMPGATLDPRLDWWLDAARRPVGAYYRIDTRSVTDMHVGLCEVGALYASATCHRGWDRGFDSKRKRDGWTIPFERATPQDGGHAFAIVGYDENGFLICNSWGKGWGDGGLATLTYQDWLENAMDCWVAQLGVPTQQHEEIARSPSLRSDATGVVRLAADRVLRNREIGPFIIDMENNGRLSSTGEFRTGKGDIDALLRQHLDVFRKTHGLEKSPVDIAIYAHGGLTGEESAANTAARWIPALYEKKIFPIFLMWETDLLSTVKNRCNDLIAKLLGEPKRTAGLRDQVERFWNARVERTLATPGSALWDEMKDNAEQISRGGDSGAKILYKSSLGVLDPKRVRLHLIGHSAGAIAHSHLIDSLSADWSFETVSFMAPAVRVDTFERLVVPALESGRVKRYHQLHLSEEMEQQDSTCRPICGYGRSLLYLVSNSFEHGRTTEILGIQKHFEKLLGRMTPVVRRRMSRSAAPAMGSISTTHGGFDDDASAVRSIIRLIHGEPIALAAHATETDPAASSAGGGGVDSPGAIATMGRISKARSVSSRRRRRARS